MQRQGDVARNVGQDVGQDVTQRNEAEAALNQGIARDWVDGNVTQNVAQTDGNVAQKGDGNVAQTKAQKRKGERYILGRWGRKERIYLHMSEKSCNFAG